MSKIPLEETPNLLVNTFRQFGNLVQGELRLAKAEMSNIASRAGMGVAFIAVSMLMALVALNVLASALVAYLAETGLSVGTAAIIVGGILLLAALGLALLGKSRLSPEALAPERTVKNVEKDIAAMKEATNV